MTETALPDFGTPDFATIEDDFAFIDDWDEKYRYLIDLGRRLPPFPDVLKTETTRIRGCASQVWLHWSIEGDTLHLTGDSDAAIVKGLVALILSLYDRKLLAEIRMLDAEAALARLSLNDHITPQRANGVASMLKTIRQAIA